MLAKRLVLLFVLMAALFSLSMSTTAMQTCSGDNCGCGYYAAECRQACAEETETDYFVCLRECRKEEIACAKACCECCR